MEKKNTNKKHDKSKPFRIPNYIISELETIGEGDWKKGMFEAISSYKIVKQNPELKLMNDVDILMTDLRCYYGENHYDHFDNFPSCFRQFLRKGHLNWKMLNKRFERTLDEIKEKGVVNAE